MPQCAYAFDRAGNRLSETFSLNGAAPTVTSRSYNTANQIASAGFTYDANGNLTSDGVNAYTWDRANRLLSMGGASYGYDGAGNRIRQTVGANVTQYLLDLQPGLSVVLAATQGANTTRYVQGPLGIHAHKDATNNWEWPLQDGLGSVRGVVDNSAAVLESRQYDPYGTPFGTTGTNQTMYGFTGEPTDSGTGLVHLRARDYAPGLGMFTALDPYEGMAQRPMSLNEYSWVEGNVPNLVDPSGKLYETPYLWNRCKPNNMMIGSVDPFGENALRAAIRRVQALKDAICRDGVCGEYKEYYRDSIHRDSDFSNPDEMCFNHFDNMCQILCGGNFLDNILRISHDGKGLFDRWIEYGVDELGLDSIGRDNHGSQYDLTQSALITIFENWQQRRCSPSGEDLPQFLDNAQEWTDKPLPFIIIPQICVLGTCFRIPFIPIYLG